MDLFDDYEKDILQLLERIQRRISQMGSLRGAQKIQEQEELQEVFKEAEDLLQIMKIDAQKPSPHQSDRQGRLKARENELASLRQALKRAEVGFGSAGDRGTLLGGEDGDEELEDLSALDQRTRLLHETEKLENSTEIIRSARRVTEETIDVGHHITVNLTEQTERLRAARDKVSGMNETLKKAKKLLQDLWKAAVTNKCLMVMLILVILAVIGVVVWLKWFNKSSDSSPAQSPTSSPTTSAPSPPPSSPPTVHTTTTSAPPPSSVPPPGPGPDHGPTPGRGPDHSLPPTTKPSPNPSSNPSPPAPAS